MLPTLMRKGNLVAPDGKESTKRKLDQFIPYLYIIDWFTQRLNKTGVNNRLLILRSETASGKSTVIPARIAESFTLKNNKNDPGVICTQPRVATAIGTTYQIMQNYKIFRLGYTIGWSTKHNKLKPQNNGLLFATVQTLTQLLKISSDEEFETKFKFVLIDETHERDLGTDMAICMLKNLLRRRSNSTSCPFVVLMSATFDPDSLLNYFGVSKETNFIWCTGASQGFDTYWWGSYDISKNNAGDVSKILDYTKTAADVVKKIVFEHTDDEQEKGNILIFLPGKAEMLSTAGFLRSINFELIKAGHRPFVVLMLDSDTVRAENDDYQRITFIKVGDQKTKINDVIYTPQRMVIMCTNVAETGLTIEGLKYVIDAGFNREMEYNPLYGVSGLITKSAPQSRIKQRRGRAGRKFPGVFYPLYTEETYNKLQVIQYPQVLVGDVKLIILDIINEQMKAKTLAGDDSPQFIIDDIDMVDPPTPEAMSEVIEKLYMIGLVSTNAPKWNEFINEDNIKMMNNNIFGLSNLGMIASQMPTTIESSRMIMAGYSYDCSIMDLITIAAYLSIDERSIVLNPPEERNPDGSIKKKPKLQINWAKIYSVGMPQFIHDPYEYRALVADDFIDGLILFCAIRKLLDTVQCNRYIAQITEFCNSTNLNILAILGFISNRDEIIEAMITAGINVMYNFNNSIAETSADNFMDYIVKLKYCIYDGYRCNVMMLNCNDQFCTYKTLMGLTVNKPKTFSVTDKNIINAQLYNQIFAGTPKFIIYRNLSISAPRPTKSFDRKPTAPQVDTWTANADKISVLDGFVAIDIDYYI